VNTINCITIEAPWDKVFDAVAAVEKWPQLLKHYRYVNDLPGALQGRRVEMAAFRDGVPCRWVSDMSLDRPDKKIHFHHVQSRFTQGMDVWWNFYPVGPHSTEVVLTHDSPAGPWWRNWFDQKIIAEQFVHNIAHKTQLGIKRHLEIP
jgi:uncharacterized membrane protein